ncbi:MAG: hypothetical protein ACHQ4J_11170, partial [Candidatus Binatia bacterium]
MTKTGGRRIVSTCSIIGRRRSRLVMQLHLLGAVLAFAAKAFAGSAPPALSADNSPVNLSSKYGSGHFGSWFVDGFRLPAFRY